MNYSRAVAAIALALLAMLGTTQAGEKAERVYEMRTYYAPEGRLDDLHRARKISDEAYQKRRAELKEILKEKM